jgi:hypothetical protein
MPSRDMVIKGPVSLIDELSLDDDNDGILNYEDECPNTLEGALTFANGCRCYGGTIDTTIKDRVTYYKKGSNGYDSVHYGPDWCDGDQVVEQYCNPDYESGKSDIPVLEKRFDCLFECVEGTCGGSPHVDTCPCCSWGFENCDDGVKNQDETGIDCGGICAPCASSCETNAKYAPTDTPCTKYYPNDPHRVDMTWTDSDLEKVCNWYEVCHPGLDFIIEEASSCCSQDLDGNPLAGLCKQVQQESDGNCKKCRGLYIIRGLGRYKEWITGYHELADLYTNPVPTAERLISVYGTGVCRDYGLLVTTLLRKAGYKQDEVMGFCDGAHCYNLVKLPGDSKYHVVDTTGNSHDINIGGLPSNYDYCTNLDESNWCYWTGEHYTGAIKDIDEYWSIVNAGGTYDYPARGACAFTREFLPQSGPGLAVGRDNFRLPDYAPASDEIIGCS